MTDREVALVSLAAAGFFTLGLLSLYGPGIVARAWRLRQHRRRHGRLIERPSDDLTVRRWKRDFGPGRR